MSTAQDYFNGIDKEAIMLNQMAKGVSTSKIPHSGAKIGRLPKTFGSPIQKVNPTAVVKPPTAPGAPAPLSIKKNNWANNHLKPSFRFGGSPSNAPTGVIKI